MNMKPIFAYIAKGLTGIFVIGLLGWAASLTIKAVQTAIPGDPFAPYLALALFDGGALTWLNIFLSQSKGTPQRAVSLLLTVLDLAGVIAMSAGGLQLIGGNAIAKVLLLATLANLSAWYFHKISSPEAIEAIEAQNIEDTLTDEARKQARANIQREARGLGAIMARRATSQIKYRLALPMTEEERKEWQENTVDGEVTEPPALTGPQAAPRVNLLDWLLGFFGRGRRSPQPLEPITTTNSNDSGSPEEAPGQPEPKAE